MSEMPTPVGVERRLRRARRAVLVERLAQVERVGDRVEHRLGRHVGLGRVQRRRELDVVGAELLRELEPVLDGAVRIGVADLARRQLLQRGGEHADLHELRLERLIHRHRRYVHLRPDAALLRALENRLDDAVGAVAVLERREGRRMRIGRLLAGGDEAVDVAHHVAERVGPGFLVAARQVRVARAPRRRAATDPSAGSRWPCRGGRSTARSAAPAASAATPSSRRPRAADRSCGRRRPGRPRTLPFAPLSNRSSTDARSSTLMSTCSTSLVGAAAGERLARARRLLALSGSPW